MLLSDCMDALADTVAEKQLLLRATLREHGIDEGSPAWIALMGVVDEYTEALAHYSLLGEL